MTIIKFKEQCDDLETEFIALRINSTLFEGNKGIEWQNRALDLLITAPNLFSINEIIKLREKFTSEFEQIVSTLLSNVVSLLAYIDNFVISLNWSSYLLFSVTMQDHLKKNFQKIKSFFAWLRDIVSSEEIVNVSPENARKLWQIHLVLSILSEFALRSRNLTPSFFDDIFLKYYQQAEVNHSRHLLIASICLCGMFDVKSILFKFEWVDILLEKVVNKAGQQFFEDEAFFMLDVFSLMFLNSLIDLKSLSSLSHYTSIQSLEKILKNSEIKFSKTTNVNDCDEGKLVFDNHNSSVYVSSWTRKSDSMDLWGNYTNYNGVEIIIDKQKMGSFQSLILSDKEFLSTSNLDFGDICYSKSKTKMFLKSIDKLIRYISNPNPQIAIGVVKIESINIFKEIWSFLFKRESWSYEYEYRMIISPSKLKDLEKLKNGDSKSNYRIEGNSVFLKFDLSCITEIKLGPGIKNSEIIKKGVKEFLSQNKISAKLSLSKANLNK